MPNIILSLLSLVLSFTNTELPNNEWVAFDNSIVKTIESNYSYDNTGGAVVWTEPAFPTQTDFVKVFFNAKQGNGALEGFTGDVYAHTGLITSNSTGPTDWQHVQGNWGTADPNVFG